MFIININSLVCENTLLEACNADLFIDFFFFIIYILLSLM